MREGKIYAVKNQTSLQVFFRTSLDMKGNHPAGRSLRHGECMACDSQVLVGIGQPLPDLLENGRVRELHRALSPPAKPGAPRCRGSGGRAQTLRA